MSVLDSKVTPLRANTNEALPVLRTLMGSTKNQALTTTAGAAIQMHNGTRGDVPVRIWAIGCPVVYVFGASGVAAPNAITDGYVGTDRYIDTWMMASETHIRCAAATGTGEVRIEVLT